MFELQLEGHFSAAHRLREYEGACEKLHGHNYRVQVFLRGAELNDLGMLIDFGDAREALDAVLGRLDHEYLNEIEPFDELNPSTEHIARHVAESLDDRFPAGVSVVRVTCWESEKSAASYLKEGN